MTREARSAGTRDSGEVSGLRHATYARPEPDDDGQLGRSTPHQSPEGDIDGQMSIFELLAEGSRRPSFKIRVLYHVPRSRVWQGSCGGQRGYAHIHVANGPARFTAENSRSITRGGGVSLCQRHGWYEHPAESGDKPCPKCRDLAERYGVEIPEGWWS